MSGSLNKFSVPSHVPDELVRDFNFATFDGVTTAPHGVAASLHEGPRIFFTPNDYTKPEGTWVLTRAEDMRNVLTDTETFSSRGHAGFSRLIGESWPLLPLEVDPPDHLAYRKLLNPLFTPKAVEDLAGDVRALAQDLIAQMKSGPECEFMEAFGRPFPVSIFLKLMGLPLEHMPMFMGWVENLLHSHEFATMAGAARSIVDYLKDIIADRSSNPRDDIISRVVNGAVDGRSLTDDEKIGIIFLAFSGGLDTVASSLGFVMQYLAENPDRQALLRSNPALIPSAVEELYRYRSVVVTKRIATKDTEIGGVKIKAGDWVTCPTMVANFDPQEFSEPQKVDFERNPNRHLAFAFGAHRCLGVHLARREAAIALEEMLEKLPPFALKPGAVPRTHGGGVFGVDELQLIWVS
jgi:cytochrome P450